jgi:flagellar motility protein MotE (MotC chaperone)
MKLKDLLGISLVSVFLFPVVLIGIMLAAGVVHLEAGDGKDKERLKPVFTGEDQAKQEEAEAKQLKAFKALEQKEKELNAREAEVNRETERLENLKLETVQAKDQIAEERRRIEEAVGKSAEAQDKQIAALAEVYGGMRPEEAAPILLSLDNAMVVRIMKKIPEARATSKLMAALAALDVKRAAAITTLMGGKGKAPKAAPAGEGGPESGARPAGETGPKAGDAAKPAAKTENAKPTDGGTAAAAPKAQDAPGAPAPDAAGKPGDETTARAAKK